MADRAFLERLTKDLANQGKLIEAGWVGLRLAAIPDNAPAIQLQEMRMAYMAGAQHLFWRRANQHPVWVPQAGLG